MGKILGAVPALLLAFSAAAADDPETVYGKLHRATLAGNVDEVMSYATAARRKEMAALPGREDMVRMLAMMLPKTYTVTKRDVGGGRARLELRGVHDSSGPARGSASLVSEKGEWKVDQWSWDSSRAASDPAMVRVQAAPPAMTKSAPQGSMKGEASSGEAPATAALMPVEAPTLRRASADTMPCVIKPVMTDDDLRRCGANPPRYEN